VFAEAWRASDPLFSPRRLENLDDYADAMTESVVARPKRANDISAERPAG
jgi:hypothetical protein